MSGVPAPIVDAYPSVDAFEALDIDAEAFSHPAHVYVAWQLLQQDEVAAAAQRFTAALRRLVRKLGFEDKYHETISWFYMLLIAERQASQQHTRWDDFAAANPDLLGDARKLLDRHYTAERLWSRLAKRQFLLPDRAPPAS